MTPAAPILARPSASGRAAEGPQAGSPERTLAGVAAVVLACDGAPGLHELCAGEPAAALLMAGRRRLVDFALQEVARAGCGGATVVLGRGGLGPAPAQASAQGSGLAQHLVGAWGGRLALRLGEGLGALAPLLAAQGQGQGPGAAGEVVLIPGARAGAFDLAALVASHRAGGAAVTLLDGPGDGPGGGLGDEPGALVLDRAWLASRLALEGDGPPGGEDGLLGRLAACARAEGALALARQDAPWRAVPTLDAFRLAWLELARGVPFPLPPERGAPEPSGGDALQGPDLVVEAGGLTLTVPRFGARRGGRWTLLEDSAVMPGARVAPGARLSRAVVAPGAIVPSNLVVGEDPEDDARWFRVTAPDASPGAPPGASGGGTTLVTAAMLARRAAERMRLHAGPAPRAGLPTLEPS